MEEPGQFVHIKVSNQYGSIAASSDFDCQIDHSKNEFTIIYRKQGPGTSILAEKKTGDQADVLGPLGHGFPLAETSQGETALLVGGGIGVPPLYELSHQLVKKAVKVIHVLGFQTKSAVFYEDKFPEFGETMWRL